MPRYRLKSAWHGDEIESGPDPLLPGLTVDGSSEVDTGLVDAEGRPIMRVPNAIGFQAEIN